MKRSSWIIGSLAAGALVAGGLALRPRHAPNQGAATAVAESDEAGDDEEAAHGTPAEARRRGGNGSGTGNGNGSGTGSVEGEAALATGTPAQLAAAQRYAAGMAEAQRLAAQQTPFPGGPGDPGMPRPTLAFSSHKPAESAAEEAQSPTLAKIIEVTQPTSTQEAKIRELWHLHEAARRNLLANAPPSAAPPEVVQAEKLATTDGEFEMALVSKVLQQDQIDRLLDAIRPLGQKPGAPK